MVSYTVKCRSLEIHLPKLCKGFLSHLLRKWLSDAVHLLHIYFFFCILCWDIPSFGLKALWKLHSCCKNTIAEENLKKCRVAQCIIEIVKDTLHSMQSCTKFLANSSLKNILLVYFIYFIPVKLFFIDSAGLKCVFATDYCNKVPKDRDVALCRHCIEMIQRPVLSGLRCNK